MQTQNGFVAVPTEPGASRHEQFVSHLRESSVFREYQEAFETTTGLPLTTTTDPKEVAKRRDAVADALVAAKTALWTSEATGFTSHELGRTLKVVESPHGK